MAGKGKLILAILLILFIIASIPITIFLVRQRQEIRKRAAVPEGEATVSLLPATGAYQVDQSFPVSITFNTANIPISAIAVRLTYLYSGTLPEVTASGIEINSSLLATGDWSCPVKTIAPLAGTVKIDIACVNTSIAGFSTSTDTLLATFDLVASQVPVTNPITLKFDSTQSVITRKSDAEDILLIPASTGSYTIVAAAIGGGPTATPTPTLAVQPTPTPTPTVGFETPTPTPTVALEEVPETGILTPTLIFLTSGGVFLLFAFLLL